MLISTHYASLAFCFVCVCVCASFDLDRITLSSWVSFSFQLVCLSGCPPLSAGSPKAPELRQALTDAWALQKDVLTLLKSKDPETFSTQKAAAAAIGYQLAQFHQTIHENDKAQQFYAEALKLNDGHDKSLLAMAKLQVDMADHEQAQQTAQVLMRVDPGNEEGALMLSDLLFRKGDHELAVGCFKSLLEKKPNHYSVLQKLILLLRRSGRLGDATRFLKAAHKSSARADYDAGLHYCQGLHAWYVMCVGGGGGLPLPLLLLHFVLPHRPASPLLGDDCEWR